MMSTKIGSVVLLSLIFLLYPWSLLSPNSSHPSADFDGNGTVAFQDFLLFVEAFGTQEGQQEYKPIYDLDGNGEIGFSDFLIFVDNFGNAEFVFTFQNDAEGWIVGFADLPANFDPSLYELDSGYRPLPSPLEGNGLYIKGHNRSDDLFMFFKRQVDGLRPDVTYSAFVSLDLATNVPPNTIGIGGSPGESVYVKAGASTVEPVTQEDNLRYLRMNIDKGNQSNGGKSMVVIGHVAHPEVIGKEFRLKPLNNADNPVRVTSDGEGGLWLIVGTDSGFEGPSTLYYDRIAYIFKVAEAQASEPSLETETVYLNGQVYTQDEELPWAESIVTRGEKIVFVGSTQDALQYASRNSRRVDLKGQFVMPGIIDAHTHPGLISVSGDLSRIDADGSEIERPVNTDRMPSKPKEATIAWLQQYVSDRPFEFVIFQGAWDVATYLPDGPHKRDLDKISIIKPILLFDNSGHSFWVNSAFLRWMGVDKNTPDISENVSYFVRDENGEPTGWLKEFVLRAYMGRRMTWSADVLKERMLKFLNYMSSRGITTLWDAGNFNDDDIVYQAAHDIAKDGNLPLRWEGSYHIWKPDQIETAVESLLELREKYAHGKLQFNTIKIHYDGMQDILTAGMLDPYDTDPDNYGGVLFTTQRVSTFIQKLDSHGIDLHLHAAGDRAVRNILDAVEHAQGALGRPLTIEVTLSHLFSVADSDIKRFRELDVHANFTPHWFGGTIYGNARQINVGPERANRSQVVGHFAREQVNFTLSSDVIRNPHRVSPFIGIEMSITRQAINNANAATMPPLDANISLEQALAGYTTNGAAQLGLEEKLGTIKVGLLADFIVLPQNLFETDVERIHTITPSATIVAGELRSGSL